ncbi:MAG: hypothetical protein ABIP79_14725 [Chitinophagaceae bacterium]
MNDYNKLTTQEQEALYNNFLQEPDVFYEKAATDQLKAALKRSYKERFTVMTGLMKMNIMFSRAKIITKNSNSQQA